MIGNLPAVLLIIFSSTGLWAWGGCGNAAMQNLQYRKFTGYGLSGVYPVDAFKVAAKGAVLKQKPVLLDGAGIVPQHSLKIITRIDEAKPYTLSVEDRNTLDRFFHYQGNTINAMKDAVKHLKP